MTEGNATVAVGVETISGITTQQQNFSLAVFC